MPDGIALQILVPSNTPTWSQDHLPSPSWFSWEFKKQVHRDSFIHSSILHASSHKLSPVFSSSLGTLLGGSMTLALIADSPWWQSPPSCETLLEMRNERRLCLSSHSLVPTTVAAFSMWKPQFVFCLWVIISEWILSCALLSWEAGCAELSHQGPLQ